MKEVNQGISIAVVVAPIPINTLVAKLLTGLALQHFLDPETYFRLAIEHRSRFLLVEMLEICSVNLWGQRKKLDFFYQGNRVFHVKLDKLLDFRPVRRLDIDVNENGTR